MCVSARVYFLSVSVLFMGARRLTAEGFLKA